MEEMAESPSQHIDWEDFVGTDMNILGDDQSLGSVNLSSASPAVGGVTEPAGPPVVRLAVIGLGAVTAFHHIPGIVLQKQARLIRVCDSDAELLQNRTLEWAPTFGQLRASVNYLDVVNDPEIDAVVVATPNHTHFHIVKALLEKGKHVLCEKPLGISATEAVEMHRLAVHAGVRHMTAFTYRFAPALRYLHHLCQQGSLGHIRHFRSQRFLDWPETSWGWRQYQVTPPTVYHNPF